MQSRIVLISDDSDFFEYIRTKLMLRKSDELFTFCFDELPDKIHLLSYSLLIINSENSEDKTLELLNWLKGTPSILFAYNENSEFKVKAYHAGALGYVTPLTSDEEFQAKMIPALSAVSLLEKNQQYREILVQNNQIFESNEVFTDYSAILDRELDKINKMSTPAVLAAISPNDKTKFLLLPNQIETIILNNIRRNDVLMNYASNKYFLLLYNTNIDSAQKLWAKIQEQIPQKIYAGFANVGSKVRQQLINEVLNRLLEAINYDKDYVRTNKNPINELGGTGGNFKFFRQEFNKKIEQIVTPVFYHTQQKYNDKLFGMSIEQGIGEGYGTLYIKSRHAVGAFKITSPGFSKINIDITYQTSAQNIDAKRITLEPEELEAGVLEDLLEQFILEFKKEINDDNT